MISSVVAALPPLSTEEELKNSVARQHRVGVGWGHPLRGLVELDFDLNDPLYVDALIAAAPIRLMRCHTLCKRAPDYRERALPSLHSSFPAWYRGREEQSITPGLT